ncbi:hypothetical protein [Opitutus sp. GAS368]|uniref:hypothetical protein n=1 Tax=Opitutus sp. GAS368 TaxID=1882749 RepID=UPI0012FE2015|nr:hypothetical protein [Opitutus sp. GAS368]
MTHKLIFGAVLAVVGLAGFGFWVYLRDQVDFDVRRLEIVRALTGETAKLQAALSDVEARMAAARVELGAQQDRAAQAAKVARDLEGLSGGLNRLTTDAAQLKENDERRARMRQMEADSLKRVADLQDGLKRTQWEKDGLEIALGRMQMQLKSVEENKSKVLHYAREAWARHGPYVLLIVGLYFLGPPLGRVFLYTVFAPFVSGRSPVLLGAATEVLPEITVSRSSMDLTLGPGDTLWVKEKFLQASDEGLNKRTKTVLDWSMPVTCVAAGLSELIEMHNRTDAATYRATFSSKENPNTELVLVSVPPGASLVMRPSFLAGAVGVGGGKVRIRRHWRLFKMQSWVTGQFRYFEFVGPCRLLVAGSRGVRAEVLTPMPGNLAPARRTNQDATIGFTPGLAYRPVRAETFWAYFRGMNPLFDDLFEGEGVFLCQETSAKGPQEQVRKFWAALWGGVLRIFGL